MRGDPPEFGTVARGDCEAIMSTLPDESVHAVVTDPPYGLGFMGSSWDEYEPAEFQEFVEAWAAEALRVLKPGGHLVAFGGDRTHHRLFTGVENAGFTVRDSLLWLHGNGMPKGQDVGKSVDRWGDDEDDADEWRGWNTQLKPAHEPAVLAQKPLAESSIYRNVLEHGTGALNVERCRIANTDGKPNIVDRTGENTENSAVFDDTGRISGGGRQDGKSYEGRYPANVLLDDEAAALLDEQAGECLTGDHPGNSSPSDNNLYGKGRKVGSQGYKDTGGASRFYYCSKAATSERTHNGAVENPHPTVKPLDVMRWLVRLVAAEGQVVLDPFCGSGTTLLAAEAEGREWLGIEREQEYAELARTRLEHMDELDLTPTDELPNGAAPRGTTGGDA